MIPLRLGSSRKDPFLLALVFGAYVLTGYFGLHLDVVHSFAALVWAPTGISIAFLFLFGRKLAPAVFFGAFVVNLITGAPFFTAFIIGIGNTLEAVCAVELLERARFNPLFNRLRDAVAFSLVSLAAPMVSATVGTLALYASQVIPFSAVVPTWVAWWIGDTLGALVIGSFLMKWIRRPALPSEFLDILEWTAIFVVCFIISFLLFFIDPRPSTALPLTYPLLIPLIWAALRIGPRGVTVCILLISVTAITGTLHHTTVVELSEGILVPLQLYIGTLSGIFLIFAATSEERRQGARALMRHVEHLENALARLQAEDEAKSNFVAVLAHELRNPLAPLLSSLELLRLKGGTNDPIREQINGMRGRVRSMARLLDDLLDISRISHHKLSLHKEKVDLKRIVERARETVEPQIKSANHVLLVTCPEKSVDFVGDPLRLEQIVVNLLTNSVKYTEPGGKIVLSLTTHRGHAVIRVRDTGIGISKELLQRIFDPFIQAESARRMSKGLGIGLALSKNLVEMHGGTIEARSGGQGQGSEFIVRFPLQESMARVRNAEHAKQLKFMSPVAKSLRIFLTDDNQAAADTLRELLEHIGHEVKVAYTGNGALKEIPKFNPHVIILDIGLPDIEGYDVARKLKEQGTPATLIALTGYGQEEDKDKAKDAGFEYHLVKPVGIADLEALLKQVTPKI